MRGERLLIIFVGPQGVGKSTHAKILSMKLKSLEDYNPHISTLVHYTIFHVSFVKSLFKLCKTNTVTIKFYEDLPPQPSPSPEVYKRLFSLLIFLHFIGYIISLAKYKLLKMFYRIIIEHEGFVFKQIADLGFLAAFAKVRHDEFAWTLLRKFSRLLLSTLTKDRVIIVRLETNLDTLKKRYSARPHIEPSHYIDFQNRIYRRIVKTLNTLPNISVINMDTERVIAETHSEILNSVLSILRSFR